MKDKAARKDIELFKNWPERFGLSIWKHDNASLFGYYKTDINVKKEIEKVNVRIDRILDYLRVKENTVKQHEYTELIEKEPSNTDVK